MIPEFIPFRYQGVRRIDEIMAKPADLGWKCRKYIKWREVHNSITDAKALYSFADDLIEKNHLKLDLFGQINGVCLNVQKWRLDKEKMSVEPPARVDWEKRDILFKAAKSNPALVSAQLAQHKMDSTGLSSLQLQILFYALEIDSFFQSQGIKSYPNVHLKKCLLDGKPTEWFKKLSTRFEHAYRSTGTAPPNTGEASRFIQQVMDDLGFPAETLNPNCVIPVHEGLNEPEYLIELVNLEKFKIIDVAVVGGITSVRLNISHPFIKSVVAEGKLNSEMETFFKCYANCMLKMGGSLETLETFNSYLGLGLYTDQN